MCNRALKAKSARSHLVVPLKEKKRPSFKQNAVAFSRRRFHCPILHLLLAVFLAAKAVNRALEKSSTFVFIRIQSAVGIPDRKRGVVLETGCGYWQIQVHKYLHDISRVYNNELLDTSVTGMPGEQTYFETNAPPQPS